MSIEKLTDKARYGLACGYYDAPDDGKRALRIIDALTAENARLRAESEARRQTLVAKADELAAEWRRAEAAESCLAEANAEIARLTCIPCDADKRAAEARLATAEADNADLVLRYGENTERMILAEARLAAAVGYIKHVYPNMWECDEALRGIVASAQPAQPKDSES